MKKMCRCCTAFPLLALMPACFENIIPVTIVCKALDWQQYLCLRSVVFETSIAASALQAKVLVIHCRQYVHQDKLPDILGKYLKTDNFTTVNCRQALQKRMLKVQQQVAAHKNLVAKERETVPWRLQKSSGVVCVIFKAIENEHPYL